jgi:hypothetical protein
VININPTTDEPISLDSLEEEFWDLVDNDNDDTNSNKTVQTVEITQVLHNETNNQELEASLPSTPINNMETIVDEAVQETDIDNTNIESILSTIWTKETAQVSPIQMEDDWFQLPVQDIPVANTTWELPTIPDDIMTKKDVSEKIIGPKSSRSRNNKPTRIWRRNSRDSESE